MGQNRPVSNNWTVPVAFYYWSICCVIPRGSVLSRPSVLTWKSLIDARCAALTCSLHTPLITSGSPAPLSILQLHHRIEAGAESAGFFVFFPHVKCMYKRVHSCAVVSTCVKVNDALFPLFFSPLENVSHLPLPPPHSCLSSPQLKPDKALPIPSLLSTSVPRAASLIGVSGILLSPPYISWCP